MKKRKFFLSLCIIFLGSLFLANKVMANPSLILPTSRISPEECYLCGPNRPFDIIERPHDTIMLLCLNTWELGDTRMFDYDENGNDANYSGASNLRSISLVSEYGNWFFKSNTGYHTCEVKITYSENSNLDPSVLCKQLCNKCLTHVYDKFLDKNNEGTCSVLYDTATDTIYPISNVTSPYHINDFWILVVNNEENHTDMVYIVNNIDSTHKYQKD